MEFSYYFHYCKNLKFEDRPDYASLKSLLFDLIASKENINNLPEYMFDWFIDDENPEEQEVFSDREVSIIYLIIYGILLFQKCTF